MRYLFYLTAFLVALFTFGPAAADHKTQADPATYIWAACLTPASTDRLVAIIVNPKTNPDEFKLPVNCIAVNMQGVDEREHFPLYIGVLVDVQGNHFTVHKVVQDSGITAYLFVYELAELKATRNRRGA